MFYKRIKIEVILNFSLNIFKDKPTLILIYLFSILYLYIYYFFCNSLGLSIFIQSYTYFN